MLGCADTLNNDTQRMTSSLMILRDFVGQMSTEAKKEIEKQLADSVEIGCNRRFYRHSFQSPALGGALACAMGMYTAQSALS